MIFKRDLCLSIGDMSQVSDYSWIQHVLRIILAYRKQRNRSRLLKSAAMQLMTAAKNRDITTVGKLLTEGHVDVNITDEVGFFFSMPYSTGIASSYSDVYRRI